MPSTMRSSASSAIALTSGRLTGVADVRPFRALHYGAKAGPLATLVAPPYDVISEEERADYLARSPYNVVHLTLPDSEEEAAGDLAAWRESGVLTRDDTDVFWALSQTYTGPDGVERTRNGYVVALRIEPYDRGVVLPHERTHAGPKEGRLRLLRATRSQHIHGRKAFVFPYVWACTQVIRRSVSTGTSGSPSIERRESAPSRTAARFCCRGPRPRCSKTSGWT